MWHRMEGGFVDSFSLEAAQKKSVLDRELGLIHSLCQASIDAVIHERETRQHKKLRMNILTFYKILDELYKIIAEIATKSIDAKICSILMREDTSSDLVMVAEVGLGKEIARKTGLERVFLDMWR